MFLSHFWSRLLVSALFKTRSRRFRRLRLLADGNKAVCLPRVEGLETRHLLAPIITATLTDNTSSAVAPARDKFRNERSRNTGCGSIDQFDFGVSDLRAQD